MLLDSRSGQLSAVPCLKALAHRPLDPWLAGALETLATIRPAGELRPPRGCQSLSAAAHVTPAHCYCEPRHASAALAVWG